MTMKTTKTNSTTSLLLFVEFDSSFSFQASVVDYDDDVRYLYHVYHAYLLQQHHQQQLYRVFVFVKNYLSFLVDPSLLRAVKAQQHQVSQLKYDINKERTIKKNEYYKN